MSFKNQNFISAEEEAEHGDHSPETAPALDRAKLKSLVPPVADPKSNRFSRGSSVDSALESSLVCYHGNRRQSNIDGSKEERRSLLSEDNDVEEGANGNTHSHSSMGASAEDFEMSRLSPTDGAYSQCKDIHHSGSSISGDRCPEVGYSSACDQDTGEETMTPKSVGKCEQDKRVRTRILKRELGKIKKELSSLGELEMEVSYV